MKDTVADVEAEIIPRNLHFNISKNAKRHWFAGDPITTAAIDCLSVFLPAGERHFIRSLRHYVDKFNDPVLDAEIKGYSRQEAFHTREHEDYNQALEDLGYDIDAMEAPIVAALDIRKRPFDRLLITCAIEHITATFSLVTLRNPEIMANCAMSHRRLWMWHALEELEHQAVALDVLHTATKGMPGWKRYFLRTGMMTVVACWFLVMQTRNVMQYARTDGEKIGFKFWRRYLWMSFGKPGLLRLSIGPALRYYIPGFDPRKQKTERYIERGRAWLDHEINNVPDTTITVG